MAFSLVNFSCKFYKFSVPSLSGHLREAQEQPVTKVIRQRTLFFKGFISISRMVPGMRQELNKPLLEA